MHHFASGIFCTKYKFTQTKCRTPKRLLIMVESNLVCNHMSKLTKSGDQEEGVWFDYHLYDCWQNWTTQSPVTNWLKLWPNLRKKLVFDDAFLWKKKQQITRQNLQQQGMRMTHTVHVQRYDMSSVLLHFPVTSMTHILPYYHSNRAGNQSCFRNLL